MIIRSSRMQRTYSIAVATESTYYVRVCVTFILDFIITRYSFSFLIDSAYPFISFIPPHSFFVSILLYRFFRLVVSRAFFLFYRISHQYVSHTRTHTFIPFVSRIFILSISSCVQRKDTIIFHSPNHPSIN